MTELVICRGLPSSGKTTWAVHWLSGEPNTRSRVNRDDLRQSLFALNAGALTHEQENAVTEVHHATIRALLKNGRDVVCDDTNLRARTVRELLRIAQQVGASVQFKNFDTPPALCIERDRQRGDAGGRLVGEAVIRSFADRYFKKGSLPPIPTLDVDSQTLTYTPDNTLEPAWLVDMDGTLAKMNGRGPFEWHRVGEDDLNLPIAAILEVLTLGGYRILVVSGRDGSCRAETEQWLADNDIGYDGLFMREAGDMRKDAVVKSEIFWRDIAPHWAVQGVFDDRDQVVQMWRGLGLTCLQVAPGDF